MNAPDLGLAGRMAKVCACTDFIDKPGGIASCPMYTSVQFSALPRSYVIDAVNACCIGVFDDQVVLAFRGTLPLSFAGKDAFLTSVLAWLSDADLKPITVNGIDGRVHRGFADALLQLWPLFMEELQAKLADGRKLIVTGHGQGGALAALAASRLLGMALADAARVYTFGAPRAGDVDFAHGFKDKFEAAWRFEFHDDVVPHLPLRDKVADLLQALDPRFRNVRLPHYTSTGSLEFINWSGKTIASNGSWLDAERTGHLAQLLLEDHIDRLDADHSLERAYIPALR